MKQLTDDELGELRDDLTVIKLASQNIINEICYEFNPIAKTFREIIERVDRIAKKLSE